MDSQDAAECPVSTPTNQQQQPSMAEQREGIFPPQKNGGCQKIFFLQVDFRPKVRNLGQKKTILSNENNVTCWKFDASSKKLQLSVCLSFYPKTLLTTIQHLFLSIIN